MTDLDIEPGIYKFEDADYFALPLISKSGLDQIAISPKAFQYWQGVKKKPTKAMDLGTAVHAAILEPDAFQERFVVAPEIKRTTKAGKAEYKAWCEDNASKRVLSGFDMSTCLRASTAVLTHPVASEFLSGGHAEQVMIWDTPQGIKAKGKVDYLKGRRIVDVKTTQSAVRDSFAKSIELYRYHVQAAFYSDGLQALVGKSYPVEEFVFIVVETQPPYHVAVYIADETMLIEGRTAYEKDLRIYADCIRQDVWPGLTEKPSYISLPRRG